MSNWISRLVDETGASTLWDDQFATDAVAFAEFKRTVPAQGIRSFEEDKP